MGKRITVDEIVGRTTRHLDMNGDVHSLVAIQCGQAQDIKKLIEIAVSKVTSTVVGTVVGKERLVKRTVVTIDHITKEEQYWRHTETSLMRKRIYTKVGEHTAMEEEIHEA